MTIFRRGGIRIFKDYIGDDYNKEFMALRQEPNEANLLLAFKIIEEKIIPSLWNNLTAINNKLIDRWSPSDWIQAIDDVLAFLAIGEEGDVKTHLYDLNFTNLTRTRRRRWKFERPGELEWKIRLSLGWAKKRGSAKNKKWRTNRRFFIYSDEPSPRIRYYERDSTNKSRGKKMGTIYLPKNPSATMSFADNILKIRSDPDRCKNNREEFHLTFGNKERSASAFCADLERCGVTVQVVDSRISPTTSDSPIPVTRRRLVSPAIRLLKETYRSRRLM